MWLLGLATIGFLNIKSFLSISPQKKRKLLQNNDTACNTIKRQKVCDIDDEGNDDEGNDDEGNDYDKDWIENDDLDCFSSDHESGYGSETCPENTRHFEPREKVQ